MGVTPKGVLKPEAAGRTAGSAVRVQKRVKSKGVWKLLLEAVEHAGGKSLAFGSASRRKAYGHWLRDGVQ